MIAPFAARANRAASGRCTARRWSLLDLDTRHGIGRIDAGVLARPGVAFAFVRGDMAGGLLVAGVNDETQRRHALRHGKVADQSQRSNEGDF